MKSKITMLEDFKLKVFMAVAENGSFTIAAKALGVTQPAVSQNIAELERNMGAELFTRSRGSVTLTAAGTIFKEYAEKILYWYSAAGQLFGPTGKRGGRHLSLRQHDINIDYYRHIIQFSTQQTYIKIFVIPNIIFDFR